MTALDLVPSDLQQLLQLFSSLPEVRFPELEQQALHEAVARLQERASELAELEAQREAARVALEEEQEALLRKGHRLHAYLKVFADADEALATKVNALSLPRLRRAATVRAEGAPVEGSVAPKKRGRPRKASSTDALFADEPAASA